MKQAEVGAEVEFGVEDDEIIIRNAAELERKLKFEKAKSDVLIEWNDVFVALAKGADDKEVLPDSESRNLQSFSLSKNSDGKYSYMLRETNGEIIFQSQLFDPRDEALKNIEKMKKSLTELKDEIRNLPVTSEPVGA